MMLSSFRVAAPLCRTMARHRSVMRTLEMPRRSFASATKPAAKKPVKPAGKRAVGKGKEKPVDTPRVTWVRLGLGLTASAGVQTALIFAAFATPEGVRDSVPWQVVSLVGLGTGGVALRAVAQGGGAAATLRWGWYGMVPLLHIFGGSAAMAAYVAWKQPPSPLTPEERLAVDAAREALQVTRLSDLYIGVDPALAAWYVPFCCLLQDVSVHCARCLPVHPL